MCKDCKISLSANDNKTPDNVPVTRGAGTVTGKYVRINSSINQIGSNRYRMTITLSTSSNQVFNGYGIRVYAIIGGNRTLKGVPTISSGAFTQNTFTHDFNVTANTACYAYCVCAYCEDGIHADDRDKFENRTSSDIATYAPPYTAPSNPRLSLNRTGTIEGSVTATASYTCAHPHGTVNYNYARSTNGTNWIESGWTASNNATYAITNIQRGVVHHFKVNVRNGVGESGWSPSVTVRANSLPSKPTNLLTSTNRPTAIVNLTWTASTDADNHAITYEVYIKKNNGAWSYIGKTANTSIAYDTSSDPQGTGYQFKVDAIDALGAKTSSDPSGAFHKATQPNTPTITLDKTGIVEGNVVATATASSNYPLGNTEYQFSYYHDGIGWQTYGWSTNNTRTFNLTTARGADWHFRVAARNTAGTSGYSNVVNVKSNSFPTVPIGLAHAPKYPQTNVTLIWTDSTDVDGHNVTYNVLISKNNGAYAYVARNLTDSIYNYNNSADADGTTYKFMVEAVDALQATVRSAESNEFFKPRVPSAPSFIGPATSYQEHDFNVTWNASNFYNVPGYYEVQQSVNSGNWTNVYNKHTLTSLTFSISSINRGDTIRFRVRGVNDVGQASPWAVSNTVTRNRSPLPVTNIRPAAGYLLNVITFEWDASVEPDNQLVEYRLYISKNNGTYSYIGSTTGTSFTWAIPGNDAGETAYTLKVVSVDSLGAEAEAIGPTLRKPTPPTDPTGLGPANGYYEGHIDLTWTASNFYGQGGSYDIEVYVEDVLHTATNVPTNTYRFSLANIARGARVSYKVRARNVFNQESAWVFSTTRMYHNRIPDAPSFVLPINNGELCSRTPKIVIKTNVEHDNQQMTLYVRYNNTVYNSVTHPQYFSKTTLGNNEHIIFRHTNQLNIGNNTIEAYVSDGLINSARTTLAIRILNGIPDVNKDDYITADSYNVRADMININRMAYGLNLYNNLIAIKDDFVLGFPIVEAITAITEITDNVDSYHPNNKFAYNFIYDTPVANTTFISSNHYNQLSRALNNL